jgi:hypothetical protein
MWNVRKKEEQEKKVEYGLFLRGIKQFEKMNQEETKKKEKERDKSISKKPRSSSVKEDSKRGTS